MGKTFKDCRKDELKRKKYIKSRFDVDEYSEYMNN